MNRGRHGVVRKVVERLTGKEFAAKFIHLRDDGQKDFFKQELDSLVRQSEGAEKLHDAFESDKQVILVCEKYPFIDIAKHENHSRHIFNIYN